MTDDLHPLATLWGDKDPALPITVYDERGRPYLVNRTEDGGHRVRGLDHPELTAIRQMFTTPQRKAAARSSRSKFDASFREAMVAEVRAARAADLHLSQQASIEQAMINLSRVWRHGDMPDWKTIDRWEREDRKGSARPECILPQLLADENTGQNPCL